MRELLINTDPIYMKIWNYKKILISQAIIYSTCLLKFLIRFLKYIFKFLLKKILKYIIKLIPEFLKKKILTKIYYYPRIVVLLKSVRQWIKKNGNLNDVLESEYLLIFFIRFILFYTFKLVLRKDSFRLVLLDELKKNTYIKVELKKIIKEEADVIADSNIFPSSFYIKENSELSYSEQEIYRDLKLYYTAN